MSLLPQRFSIFCGENNLAEVYMAFRNFIYLLIGRKPSKNREHFAQLIEISTGQKKVWLFSTARMALFTALKSFDFDENAEIILPAFTCVVVPNAILYAGLKPVYADIEEKNFTSTFEQYKAKVTKNTKVIYIQHTFGIDADAQATIDWARKKNLLVIEDCAHSFGIDKIQGKSGDLAIYSLDHSKVMNVGFGGILTSSNTEIIEKLEKEYLLL